MPNLRPPQLNYTEGSTDNNTIPTKGYADETLGESLIGINNQTGTSYTVTGTDNRTSIRLTNSSDITLTLPQDSTENLSSGFSCQIVQGGFGTVNIVTQGSDVFVSDPPNNKTRTQNSAINIIKRGSGDWIGSGDIQEFSMLEIPNLLAWFDSSDEDSVSLNGSNVSQIDDKSGNNYHLTQASASLQPLYTSGTNGRHYMDFSGSGDNLFRATTASLILTGDMTMFIIVNDVGGTYAISHGGNGESESTNVIYNIATNGFKSLWEYGSGSNQGVNSSLGVSLGVPHFLVHVRDVSANTVDFYRDGEHDQVGYTNDPTGGTSGVLSLGLLHQGSTSYYSGQIGEVAIFDRKLTNDEVAQLEYYASNKWGISFA